MELVGKPVTRVVLEGRSWYPDNGKLYGELALGEFGGIIVWGISSFIYVDRYGGRPNELPCQFHSSDGGWRIIQRFVSQPDL